MNRKQDKRNLNTKNKIANAFKELSKTKQMNKISVNDIIRYCNINRNSFYYHFENIYDLIKWIFDKDVKKLIENFDGNDLEKFLNDIFDYVETHKHILSSAYNSFGREQLKEILYPHFYTVLNTIINNHTKKSEFEIDENFKKFLIVFYSEGFANSIVNYFKGVQNFDRKTQIKYLLLLNELNIKKQ